MTAAPVARQPDPEHASWKSVGQELRTLHFPWIERAVRELDPALNPGAEFWTRWSAVRYLNDDFLQRLRWEFALLEALQTELRAPQRAWDVADRLAQCRLALDRLGRRRSSGPAVATACRELLDQLARWCAEFETATISVPLDGLSAAAGAVLGHLRAGERAARDWIRRD